jgi:hypothetical protein
MACKWLLLHAADLSGATPGDRDAESREELDTARLLSRQKKTAPKTAPFRALRYQLGVALTLERLQSRAGDTAKRLPQSIERRTSYPSFSLRASGRLREQKNGKCN